MVEKASNFMLALIEAISKDQQTMAYQEITDAQSTQAAVAQEEQLYAFYNTNPTQDGDNQIPGGLLGYDAWHIQYCARNGDQDGVTRWQAQYSTDEAKARSNEGQKDGQVQSAQGQTSSDGTNLQLKAQLAQVLSSIATTTSNLLGRLLAG